MTPRLSKFMLTTHIALSVAWWAQLPDFWHSALRL